MPLPLNSRSTAFQVLPSILGYALPSCKCTMFCFHSFPVNYAGLAQQRPRLRSASAPPKAPPTAKRKRAYEATRYRALPVVVLLMRARCHYYFRCFAAIDIHMQAMTYVYCPDALRLLRAQLLILSIGVTCAPAFSPPARNAAACHRKQHAGLDFRGYIGDAAAATVPRYHVTPARFAASRHFIYQPPKWREQGIKTSMPFAIDDADGERYLMPPEV